MIAESRVSLERAADGVALLGLHDAESKNTFTDQFIAELVARLGTLAADGEARVCVVRGLPEVFSGGGSRVMLEELLAGQIAASDIILPRLLLDLPIPTIAAAEGHAVGGGLALALCCDLLILARESRYGCSFMNMGFTPGMGTTRLLPDAVGERLAAEMMFGGQMLRGLRFEGSPGVNYVLPRAEVFPKALELARRIAEKPRHPLELLKRQLSVRKRQAFEESRTSEAMMHELCFARPETARLIREEYVDP
jgi:polyketide biosynthesis enoyl-CoA hydratase PksI